MASPVVQHDEARQPVLTQQQRTDDDDENTTSQVNGELQRYFEHQQLPFDPNAYRRSYHPPVGLFATDDPATLFQREAAHAAALGIMTSQQQQQMDVKPSLQRHDMFYGGFSMGDAAMASSFPNALSANDIQAQQASFLNTERASTLSSINSPYFSQQFFGAQQPHTTTSDISPNSASSSGQFLNAYGAHIPTVSQVQSCFDIEASTLRAYGSSAVGLAAAAAAAMPPTVTHTGFIDPLDTDPRELERFAEHFKQRRIKLGVTQADVGKALAHLKMPGVGSLSQSTICRFESLTLSHNNMVALKPILHSWLEKAEEAFKILQAKELGEGALSHIVQSGILPNMEKKRKRTSIAAPEKRSLEAYFALQPRPSGEKIAAIAAKLDLKKNVVRVWFCNQRQKQKRWAERHHQQLHSL